MTKVYLVIIYLTRLVYGCKICYILGMLVYRLSFNKGGEGMCGKEKAKFVLRRLYRKGFKAIVKTKRYNIYAGILCNQVVNCTIYKDSGKYEFSLHSSTRRFIIG